MSKAGSSQKKSVGPSADETKTHVLAAGREILLAAQGALRFCKTYAESASSDQNRPHLVSFFQKAITVADELGKSIIQISPVQGVAKNVSRSVMDFLEKEMSERPAAPYAKSPEKDLKKKTSGRLNRPKKRKSKKA